MLKKYLPIALLAFMLAGCADDKEKQADENAVTETAVPPTPVIPVVLVNQYPHNATAYTEGLQFVDGFMYESTGHYGASHLYKYQLETGKVALEYKLEDKYFGEGMTVLGDKIYMLTYQERTGMVFDKHTFKLIKTFPLQNAEGWGVTNDSTSIIYSDGTDKLFFMDPATLQVTKQVSVTNNYGPVIKINELEYINGFIYANRWETELIIKIDPATGKVVGEADLRMLRAQAGIPPASHMDGAPEVLNGIAYDKEKNRIFITGKNWPKILEVKLDN